MVYKLFIRILINLTFINFFLSQLEKIDNGRILEFSYENIADDLISISFSGTVNYNYFIFSLPIAIFLSFLIDFHWFSMLFNDFYASFIWFSWAFNDVYSLIIDCWLISIGFHWFSLVLYWFLTISNDSALVFHWFSRFWKGSGFQKSPTKSQKDRS